MLIALWVPWAFALLRRAATLQALSRLRTVETADDYPANPALTPALVEKIAHEQGQGDTILYGRFFPFVGAGLALDDWSTAELLIPASEDLASVYHRQREGRRHPERPPAAELAPPTVIPFTVAEITDYVAKRLRARLQEEAAPHERIDRLTIERRRYSGAARALVVRRGRRRVILTPTAAMPLVGSGLARVALGRDELMLMIIDTFLKSCADDRCTPELRIVLRPADLQLVRMSEIARYVETLDKAANPKTTGPLEIIEPTRVQSG